MNETTYIVSGYKRCGTAMMIQALEQGGLDAAYDNTHNNYFELPPTASRSPDFPLMYEGKLFKLFLKGLQSMRVGKYRVVFMVRNPRHVADSLDLLHGKNSGHDSLRENLGMWFDIAIEKALNRKDILSLTVVHYEDIIEDPRRELRRLLDDGWNFDLEKAAGVIDPEKCHHGRTASSGVA